MPRPIWDYSYSLHVIYAVPVTIYNCIIRRKTTIGFFTIRYVIDFLSKNVFIYILYFEWVFILFNKSFSTIIFKNVNLYLLCNESSLYWNASGNHRKAVKYTFFLLKYCAAIKLVFYGFFFFLTTPLNKSYFLN